MYELPWDQVELSENLCASFMCHHNCIVFVKILLKIYVFILLQHISNKHNCLYIMNLK